MPFKYSEKVVKDWSFGESHGSSSSLTHSFSFRLALSFSLRVKITNPYLDSLGESQKKVVHAKYLSEGLPAQ